MFFFCAFAHHEAYHFHSLLVRQIHEKCSSTMVWLVPLAGSFYKIFQYSYFFLFDSLANNFASVFLFFLLQLFLPHRKADLSAAFFSLFHISWMFFVSKFNSWRVHEKFLYSFGHEYTLFIWIFGRERNMLHCDFF